jgi:O-methyltransferase
MSRARATRQLATGWLSRLSYFLPPLLSPDYGPELEKTIKAVRRHTMTSPRRLAALCDAVDHVVEADVPGAIVECGVWKGGSMMAAALTLLKNDATDRELYLFDTFAGMPPPTDEDEFSAYDGYDPTRHWSRRQRSDGTNEWHHVPAERVRANVLSTGYPDDRVQLVEGRVEDTIPGNAPEEIAVLRLDTDWYASTRHELEHLYPRLVPGGVLILDDYGHYEGARRAVDEYFDAHGGRPLLSRIDYTGRMAVKPPEPSGPER